MPYRVVVPPNTLHKFADEAAIEAFCEGHPDVDHYTSRT